MKKNVIVGQSGGPTAVINASLYGVVSEALSQKDAVGNVYGMINGIEGFLNGQIMDMAPLRESGELELIRTTPGSYLFMPLQAAGGSVRRSIPPDFENSLKMRSDTSSISAGTTLWIP